MVEGSDLIMNYWLEVTRDDPSNHPTDDHSQETKNHKCWLQLEQKRMDIILIFVNVLFPMPVIDKLDLD